MAMDPIDRHVGARMRVLRKLRAITQTQLAEALGVTFQQIQKYERGANRISAGRLFDLAQALETRIMYFYDGLDLVSAASTRRGVAEDAEDFLSQIDKEAVDLLIAFQKIDDPDLRKSILASVKKQARRTPAEKPLADKAAAERPAAIRTPAGRTAANRSRPDGGRGRLKSRSPKS